MKHEKCIRLIKNFQIKLIYRLFVQQITWETPFCRELKLFINKKTDEKVGMT